MPVSVKFDKDSIIAVLSGEIDHHSAPALRECIDSAVERARPGKLTLDFGQVSFMDSSGIGLVMGRYKTAISCGAQTEVTNLSSRAEKIMRMSGLEKLVKLNSM
ncbi:MAG: STAS domain-containing protein [Oscillospiraceae bacterium]|nr:STAS domain-containing protein [Oscillospiraceae bacterium]